MDKLDLALELVRIAKNERNRLDAYNKEIKAFYASGSRSWEERYRIEQRYSPTPHKSVINDSLKLARRMLAEEYV